MDQRFERHERLSGSTWVWRLPASAGLIVVLLAVCSRVRQIDHATVALLMVLGIVGLATIWGPSEALVGALVGGAGFDYYFLPPLGIGIASPEHWVALAAFLVTAIATGQLAAHSKRHRIRAEERAREAVKLYRLTNAIQGSGKSELSWTRLADQLVEIFGATGVALYDKRGGQIARAGPRAHTISNQALTAQTATGGPRLMDSSAALSVTPLLHGGELVGSIGITGTKLSESLLSEIAGRVGLGLARIYAIEIEDLQKNRELLTTFVRQLPAAVAMLDRELRYVEASDRWCADYRLDDPSQILGRSYYEVFPEIPERWKELHRRGLAGETLRAEEELFERGDEGRLWLRWEIRPWGNRDGLPEGILIFSEDITQHKEAEELKSAVLDAMAHEIRNPLNSVKLAATTLRSGRVGSELHKEEMLAIIEEEADRMDRCIDEAVQTARLEANELSLKKAPQHMARLIPAAIEDMGAAVANRSIQVQVPESLPPADCDKAMVLRVLKQLLNNALKYSPDDSPLTVSANFTGAAIVIVVADRGPGVAVEEQDRIFEKYYRGRTARSRAPGTGLGLASAKCIVQAHGGEIWVTTPPGGGAAFHVSLPVAATRQPVGAA